MKKFLMKLWPIITIFLLWGIFSSPYFLKGLVPFPSTYQVTFFPPWNASYGMPVKNNAMPDVITQIYPWKKLTIDAWKRGEIPLWNPYSFAGTAHAGNYQTAVFSPFNLLFFVFPMIDAWSILIILQPLLAGIFMYMFLRTLERSPIGSLIGSIAFMFCGFVVVWMAYGTLGYAALWLPFILMAIYRYYKHPSWMQGVFVSLGIAFSFFSGHFQISLYVLGASIFFLLSEAVPARAWKKALALGAFVLVGLVLAAPQFLLTYDAYTASVRSSSFTKGEVIPWQYLITIFSPDFYGNPVTRNDWFGHYAEWASFIGVIPLLAALYAMVSKKTLRVWSFMLLAFGSLALAYPTPLNDLLFLARLPAISTSAASRIIILTSFSLAALASFGIDALVHDWQKRNKQKLLSFVLVSGAIVFLVSATVFLAPILPADKLAIARRNILLPLAFGFVALAVFIAGVFIPTRPGLAGIKRWMPSVLLGFLVVMTGFDMLRYATKWMPFDPREYVFPESKTLTFLQKMVGNDRVFGGLGGEVGSYYGIPLIEGYDAMYQGRYGEFIGAAADGHIKPPERSVVLIDKYGVYTEKVLQLLGVRYLAHRLSDGQNVWAYPFWQYPHYRSIYRDEHYEVFENQKALPRAWLVFSYVVRSKDQDIIDTLFSEDVDPRKTVILEQEPVEDTTALHSAVVESGSGEGEVTMTKYTANSVTMRVTTKQPKILVLSDVFDPRWKATIDSVPTEVYRANYDFRAVVVPAGTHTIRYAYRIL